MGWLSLLLKDLEVKQRVSTQFKSDWLLTMAHNVVFVALAW